MNAEKIDIKSEKGPDIESEKLRKENPQTLKIKIEKPVEKDKFINAQQSVVFTGQ